jgi:hypothetical protein
LAQQHAGPVSGFGTTGTGLDVQEAIERIRFIAEHAAEFELFDGFDQALRVGFNGHQAVFVVVGLAHFKQLGVVCQLLREAGEGDDYAVEGFLFTTQLLCFFGVVPDGWVF